MVFFGKLKSSFENFHKDKKYHIHLA